MQMGSQKLSYERKIEILGSTVEQQKLALEQINQKKKELELEKELLATEVETNNRIRQIQLQQKKVTVAPYESNFLQELESILNEKTADAEFALKMKASAEAISVGGISLHEMQILVKEATERCREVGINYVSIYCTHNVLKNIYLILLCNELYCISGIRSAASNCQ